jgi:hypothetical protein
VRLGRTVPDYDIEFDWDIAEIQSRWSGNLGDQHDRGASTLAQAWQWEREDCTSDGHYADVVRSLQTYGFVRPLTAYLVSDPEDTGERMLGLCDGHHRLFAAIDLGLARVPVVHARHSRFGGVPLIARDSGAWDAPPEAIGEPRPIEWFRAGAERPAALLTPA